MVEGQMVEGQIVEGRRSARPDGPQSRSRSRWVFVLLMVGMFAVYFLATRSVKGLPGWHGDYESALADSGATGRPLLIAFHAAGCPPCTAMDRTVLSEAVVQQALTRYVPVRLDVARYPALADRFAVSGTPTYALADSTGKPLAQVSGYVPVEEFLRFLKRGSDRTIEPTVSAETDRLGNP